jgi:predicted deacylase
MEVGTAEAIPGEMTTGSLTVTDLPTGSSERLPVVVAHGESSGPTVWITGAIHGDEVTGLAVAQDVMDRRLPAHLSGTVVCIPTLNPAGLRKNTRSSYYHDDDPNRYFPDPDVTEEERSRPPRLQELIDGRIYEAFTDEADALLDLHTAQIGSEPFVIRDRVLHGEVRSESDATDLSDEVGELAEAIGLPIVREYVVDEYTDQNLQRSTAGAALNNAGIPAVTLELGTHGVVDEPLRAVGVASCYRAMNAVGVLESLPPFAPATASRTGPVEYPVRRAVHPHTSTAGIVRHRVQPGDVVEQGDVIADIVSPAGEHRDTVETEHEGYVIGRYEGVAAYENDPVTSLAVRDEEPLIGPREAG